MSHTILTTFFHPYLNLVFLIVLLCTAIGTAISTKENDTFGIKYLNSLIGALIMAGGINWYLHGITNITAWYFGISILIGIIGITLFITKEKHDKIPATVFLWAIDITFFILIILKLNGANI